MALGRWAPPNGCLKESEHINVSLFQSKNIWKGFVLLLESFGLVDLKCFKFAIKDSHENSVIL